MVRLRSGVMGPSEVRVPWGIVGLLQSTPVVGGLLIMVDYSGAG